MAPALVSGGFKRLQLQRAIQSTGERQVRGLYRSPRLVVAGCIPTSL